MIGATSGTSIMSLGLDASHGPAHFKHCAARPIGVSQRRHRNDADILRAVFTRPAAERRPVVAFAVVRGDAIYPPLVG